MTFEAFRQHEEPTYFEAVHLPWEADLLVCGLVYCFSILFLSFCLLVPGIAGKEKFLFILRVFISLLIGASILVTNFAMTWETANTTTSTKYKAGTGQEINATIGVNIGLRGVNITLKADDHELKGETIDYNERFGWEGLQGRQGFGPFAGRFNQEYRAAQFRGLPLAILWVAEYFTLDGEGIRWGRHYRQAGYYTHIMLWLAFPLWIMTNVLFFVLLRYGAYFLFLTGASMVTANIIWATHRNYLELEIPFTQYDVLHFSYGPSFWVCLVVGVLCMVLGAVVFILDKRMPTEIALFFGVDVLQDSEQIQVEDDPSCTVVNDRETYSQLAFDKPDAMGSYPVSPTAEDDEDIYEDSASVPGPGMLNPSARSLYPLPLKIEIPGSPKRSFRTGEHRLTKRLQRPRRKELNSDHMTAPASSTTTTPYNNMEMYRAFPLSANSNNDAAVGEDDIYSTASSTRF